MSPQSDLTLVTALAAGVAAQALARRVRVPGIVLLLVAGAALGPDGLGWVVPTTLGSNLYEIVDLAVALILFEGGLNLEISRLRREQIAIRRLIVLGSLVTVVGGALAVVLVFPWGGTIALLFGGLVAVTGPTVIGPLIEELRLRPRVATVLEAEGVLIDPVGALLAVLLLEIALSPGTGSLAVEGGVLIARVGFGALAGGAAGWLMAMLLRRRSTLPDGHANVFVLAAVLLLAKGCDAVVEHSGILAVTLAGVVVGNLRTRVDRDLREFKDQLTILAIGLLFVLLAADVRFADLQALGWRGLVVVGLLVLVVRPLSVWLCTRSSDLSIRERLFIGWIAPRGIVAAAVASVSGRALEQAGVSGASELQALVFLTIGVTVVLAGVTGPPVASLLGLRLPDRNTVAILGAQGLGLALAESLRAAGRSVLFLDSNPANCRRAEEADFPVVFGNALQERTLLRARFDGVGIVIGLTPNQMLNGVFVSRARERFSVPRGFVAASQPGTGLATELVEQREAAVLFDGPHDVERWDVRARRGEIDTGEWEFHGLEEDTPSAENATELYVILSIQRGREITPMNEGFKLLEGDRGTIAVYGPERRDAESALAAAGWRPVEEQADDGAD
ncbi:cation:proton antiporter [Myxococcota bacterium]|nr:cation:proton antiporter [Myxococcota bacterium]